MAVDDGVPIMPSNAVLKKKNKSAASRVKLLWLHPLPEGLAYDDGGLKPATIHRRVRPISRMTMRTGIMGLSRPDMGWHGQSIFKLRVCTPCRNGSTVEVVLERG